MFKDVASTLVKGLRQDNSGGSQPLDTNILGLLEAACLKRAASMRASLGTEAKSHHEFDSEQLSDGAKVRRMPRAQVPAFLVQKLDKPAVECEASPTERNLDRLAKAYKKYKVKDGRQKVHDRQRLSKPQTWDLPAYKSFARIGQLRNDADLFRAGVVIADQAVAGNELVNSVPMASLRLGPSPSWLEPSSTNHIDESFSSSLSRGPSSVLFPEYGWRRGSTISNLEFAVSGFHSNSSLPHLQMLLPGVTVRLS